MINLRTRHSQGRGRHGGERFLERSIVAKAVENDGRALKFAGSDPDNRSGSGAVAASPTKGISTRNPQRSRRRRPLKVGCVGERIVPVSYTYGTDVMLMYMTNIISSVYLLITTSTTFM